MRLEEPVIMWTIDKLTRYKLNLIAILDHITRSGNEAKGQRRPQFNLSTSLIIMNVQ